MRCEIIKDLIPLYCDDALSEVSKEEVERHIAECSECRKEYEDMKNGDIKINTSSQNIEPMKKVKKKMRLTKILFGLILAVVVLLGTTYELLCAHPRLAKSDQISFIPEVTNYGIKYEYPNPDEDEFHPFVVAVRNKEEKDVRIDRANNCVYVGDEKLLDDDGKPVPANGKVVPWGNIRVGVHVNTGFQVAKEKIEETSRNENNIPNFIVELRPCLPFRQDMHNCIYDPVTAYFDYPLEYLTLDTTLTIRCRDRDIPFRPYSFSGLIIED